MKYKENIIGDDFPSEIKCKIAIANRTRKVQKKTGK